MDKDALLVVTKQEKQLLQITQVEILVSVMLNLFVSRCNI